MSSYNLIHNENLVGWLLTTRVLTINFEWDKFPLYFSLIL